MEAGILPHILQSSIFDAVEISKEELEKISFTGMEYRRDIGYEFE